MTRRALRELAAAQASGQRAADPAQELTDHEAATAAALYTPTAHHPVYAEPHADPRIAPAPMTPGTLTPSPPIAHDHTAHDHSRTHPAPRTAPAPVWTPKTVHLGPRFTARGVVGILIGIALIGGLFALNMMVPGAPLPTRIQDGLTLSISVLIESLPFVVLGVLLSIVVQVWVPRGAIERWMPRRGWARRLALSLLGILVPVCECGNVPFARGLMMRGFSVSDTLTFLVAAPIVSPIVIISTYQAFGFSDGILIARIAGGFVIANLIGWLYSRHPRPEQLLTERFRQTCEVVEHEQGGKWHRSGAQFFIELRAVMPALIIGSALAGAVQVLVPRDALLAIGSNPVLSIVAMIALAMIVSICSNVDAFFALSFASTFTPGAITAFLIVGPLVDVKMLALLRTTFTTRVLVGMVVTVVLSAFAIGIGVNLLA